MSTFIIEYRYVSGRSADLDRIRPTHREHLRSLAERGMLLASGPWVAEAGAALIMRAASLDEVYAALDEDPFAAAGLIAERTAREWEPVIGLLTP